MEFAFPDVVSSVALVVSFASVFYAKQAVEAARAGNRINVHLPRKEIFEATFRFRSLFVELDAHPTDAEIHDFYVNAVLPGHLYLSPSVVQEMHRIYATSLDLYRGIEQATNQGNSDLKWCRTHDLQKLATTDLDRPALDDDDLLLLTLRGARRG